MLHAAALPIVNLHALSVFAVLALLTLPVDLRAGLRDFHPHALLQIIDDEADGALDHDHAAIDQGYGVHDHHDHHAIEATPGEGVSPDLPRLSSAGAGVGVGLVVAMIGLLQPPRETPVTRRIIAAPPSLRGVVVSPPIPPPRLVARLTGADEAA